MNTPNGVERTFENPLRDVAQVLDRGRRAAGDADDHAAVEDRRVGQVVGALDLDRGLAGDPDESGELLGIGARAATDDDHQVDRLGGLDRIFLAADRDRADSVDDLELVAAADHERGELLELPRRLGRLADEGEALLARDLQLPLLFLVDDDRVGREAEHADDLGVVRGAEEDDRVALVDELHELAVLLDDPGAGAIDDLEAALVGALHHVRPDAVGPNHDGGTVVHVVEGLDGLDPEALEIGDHALVVDDLAEGMGRLASGAGFLGLVDRLAHAVAEAGASGDPDLPDASHTSRLSHARCRRPSAPDRGPSAPRFRRTVASGLFGQLIGRFDAVDDGIRA